jgi:ATP adenylyltransferase
MSKSTALFAPWRIQYILGPHSSECFLCTALESKADREHLLLHRGGTCSVIMNRFPYTCGHLMIITNRHVDTLVAMTRDERAEMMELTSRSTEILTAAMKPHGFNTGLNLGKVAGAGLDEHIHQHVVPRWNGDNNFMPVTGSTHVIPQALDELYEILRPHFERL